MLSDSHQQLAQVARTVVGSVYRNTLPIGSGACVVCRGPSMPSQQVCSTCSDNYSRFGASRLANLVVPLMYVEAYKPGGWSQAHTDVRNYKDPHPVAEAVQRLALIMLAFEALHGACVRSLLGAPRWEVAAFVPSTARPVGHPLNQLLTAALSWTPDPPVVIPLVPVSETSRTLVAGSFRVDPVHVPTVAGKHVLLVEDTWVSGAAAQSAAMALKDAGARSVTILCAGRWMSHRTTGAPELLAQADQFYDPLHCPVGVCAPAV